MRLPLLDLVPPPHLLSALVGLAVGLLINRRGRSITRLGTGDQLPFAHAVVHGDTVYLSGVTANADAANGPIAEDDSVEEQTKRVLNVIDERLARAGTDKSKVMHAQVWLKDIGEFAAMNRAWNAWVGAAENKPVRATVQATLATPAMLVEIMVTAAK